MHHTNSGCTHTCAATVNNTDGRFVGKSLHYEDEPEEVLEESL